MNRRGFISRGLAALGGLLALPFCKNVRTADKPVEKSWAYGNLMDPGSWSNAPRRRVLVMTSWHVPEELDYLFAEPRDQYPRMSGRALTGFKDDPRWTLTPRVATSWRGIQFEELKKGDHFRLIDVPQIEDVTRNEDGKLVHVAGGDPYPIKQIGETYRKSDGVRVPNGPDNYGIPIVISYEGKGAGFDWYQIDWPVPRRGESGGWTKETGWFHNHA